MEDGGEHYTVDEAARALGLSPARVRQMCRSGELEAERREERIEGVLGPWRIARDSVEALEEKHAQKRNAEETTMALSPRETLAGPPAKGPDARVASDTPSEASELLSESVREIRERAEALVGELERLEGRLEFAEIQDLALREALKRETRRSEALEAELEAERSRRRRDP